MPSRIGADGTREYRYPGFQVWYYDHLKRMAIADTIAKMGPRQDSPDAARARLANMQADMVEFELARKRGEFMAVGDHMRQYEALATRMVEPTKKLKPQFLERVVALGIPRDRAETLLHDMEDWLRSEFFTATADYEEVEPEAQSDAA